MILQPKKASCCHFHVGIPLLWCASSYSGSDREQKFGATCGVLTMVLLLKVSSTMLWATNITLSILLLGLQQTMQRQCGSVLKQNLNQCLAQQIVTWFQITWQSSCGIRDLKNILTSNFGLKLPNSILYELHDKNKSKKWLF